MNDERFLKDWLRDTTDTRADPNAAADKVVAQTPDTPQRRRWLPWPPARHPKHHDPSTTRRTRLMFSPINAILAGALSLTLGAALLISQPLGRQENGVPGAAAGPVAAPAIFFGTFGMDVGRPVSLESAADGVHDDGWSFNYDGGFEGSGWTTSDSRMSGKLDWISNEETAPDGGVAGDISTTLMRIRNDEGSWTGLATWVSHDESGRSVYSAWLTGAGAYEGLNAYVTMVDFQEILGFITPEGRPPAPAGFPMDLAD